MDLNRKYEFLQPLPDPTVSVEQTVPVQERTSGRILLLHLFPAGRGAEEEPLLQQAGQLPSEQQCHIVEIGQWQGAVFIVTSLLPGTLLFRTWLGASAGVAQGTPESIPAAQPAAPAVDAVPIPPEPPVPAGEQLGKAGQWAMPAAASPSGKTRLRIPQWDAGEFQAAQQKPAAAEPEPAAAPAASGPGEFTRMMQMAQAAPPAKPAVQTPPEPPPVTPAPVVSPAPASEPGEFTRLMNASQYAPKAPAEPVMPAAPIAQAAAASAEAPVVAPPPPPVTPVPAPAPSTTSGPGEFTRMIRASQFGEAQPPVATPHVPPPVAAPPPPPPVATPPPSWDQPVAQAQPAQSDPLPTWPPQQSSPTPAAPSSNEPGEFTRMLHASWKPGAASPGSTPAFSTDMGAPLPPNPAPMTPAGSWQDRKSDDLMQMFDTAPPAFPPVSATPAVPSAAPSEPGEFTRIFSGAPVKPEAPAPRTPSTPYGQMQSSMPSVAPPPVAPPPAVKGGPGEFTRMMATPARPPAPPAAAAAQAQNVQAVKSNPMTPLIIGLSILLVLAIVAVIVFWLIR